MVFERLIDEYWFEKKPRYAFIFGACYSVIGISFAKLLFPNDPALVAVAITSILFLPTLYKIYDLEEKQAKTGNKFTLRKFWDNESDFVAYYLAALAGVFIIYTLAAFWLPAFQVNDLFQTQLDLRGASGDAFSISTFDAIITNNIKFLVATFFIALIIGDGAIFLLIWNVSVWGTIFGVTARNAAIFAGTSPVWYLLVTLAIVLPHAFLEVLSYVLGAISGGMVSKDVVLEKDEKKSDQFKAMFYKYVALLVLGALICLVLGALLETWVLTNVETYKQIIAQSYGVA